MRKFFEKIVEGGLLISGSVSSFTILLIVFFLFKEAGGLFNTPATEEGYVLAVNKSNDVGKLSPEKIMDIFDGNITNWKDISGMDQDILIFRFSDLTNYYTEEELGDEFQYVPQKISELVAKEPGIIAFFPKQYLLEKGFQGKVLPEEKITLGEFFGGTKWYPTSTPAPIFGLIPLLLGTLLVSIGAIVLSLPFGIAVAIYMAEIANKRTRDLLKPIIELLAGIPSIVYGFFGLVVLVPFIREHFKNSNGQSILCASILLGIMILPTIIGASEPTIRAVEQSYYEGALALGATHERSVFTVVVPAAKSGILAAVILGVGRALGETMAVMMVVGNQPRVPNSILQGVRTLTTNIVMEMGYATDLHREALIATGVVLFAFILIINLCFSAIKRSGKE